MRELGEGPWIGRGSGRDAEGASASPGRALPRSPGERGEVILPSNLRIEVDQSSQREEGVRGGGGGGGGEEEGWPGLWGDYSPCGTPSTPGMCVLSLGVLVVLCVFFFFFFFLLAVVVVCWQGRC